MNSPECCEQNIPKTGYCKDGEIWECPNCGHKWEHACDEAEGCCWFPILTVERRTRTMCETCHNQTVSHKNIELNKLLCNACAELADAESIHTISLKEEM